jgi:hypothetical protein
MVDKQDNNNKLNKINSIEKSIYDEDISNKNDKIVKDDHRNYSNFYLKY